MVTVAMDDGSLQPDSHAHSPSRLACLRVGSLLALKSAFIKMKKNRVYSHWPCHYDSTINYCCCSASVHLISQQRDS